MINSPTVISRWTPLRTILWLLALELLIGASLASLAVSSPGIFGWETLALIMFGFVGIAGLLATYFIPTPSMTVFAGTLSFLAVFGPSVVTLDYIATWGTEIGILPILLIAMLAIGILVGGGLFLVTSFLWKLLGHDVLVQSGHLCWTCGYIVGASQVCSECGAKRRSRNSVFPYIITAILAIGIVSTIPIIHNRFGRGAEFKKLIRLPGALPTMTTDGTSTKRGVVISDPTHPTRAIALYLNAKGDMELELQWLISVPGGGRIHVSGATPIVCHVDDPSIVEGILSNGVPSEVFEVMNTAAAEAGWSSPPRPGVSYTDPAGVPVVVDYPS